MSETLEVLAAMEASTRGNQKSALATIVATTGSTYRRPGARLFVPEEGEATGNLSGGCLEGEVQEVARTVMTSGQPRLEHYDLTADDEVVWGWGLGCNGAITVFIEPAERAAQVAGALTLAIEERRPVVLATALEASRGTAVGARLLVAENGSFEGTTGNVFLDADAARRASRSLDTGVSEMDELEGARFFFEVIEPPVRLVLCGAGHDAVPLVEHAAGLGWSVTVVDDRPELLTAERYPGADELIVCEPDEVAAKTHVDKRTNVVVMSHNFFRDRAYLGSLLSSGAGYVGMLGPGARLQRLLGELGKEGIEPAPGDLGPVHGPAGLDIGAEGPEEIAVAIIAEIMAVRRKRGAGFLRSRGGSIHD